MTGVDQYLGGEAIIKCIVLFIGVVCSQVARWQGLILMIRPCP